jgi:hypothetical protein
MHACVWLLYFSSPCFFATLAGLRNEPLLESDGDDYETSSHDIDSETQRKSPRHGTTKDGERLAKTKAIAAVYVSTGQPVTTPPPSRGDDE